MEKDYSKIQLADVLEEMNADLVIDYHTTQIKYTKEQLQDFKAQGWPTDGLTCIVAGLFQKGMDEKEVEAFMTEAYKAKHKLKIRLEVREGKLPNLPSAEENSGIKRLVQSCDKVELLTDEEPEA